MLNSMSPTTMSRMILSKAIILIGLLSAVLSSETLAQTQPARPPQAAKPETGPQNAAPQLDSVLLLMLVKSVVVAVQHANQTGNYSVLRDLGTPVFRERFDQARLTAIFANMRARGVNLSPAIVLAPTLSKKPEISPQGILNLTGAFPTQPLQIQFNLFFQQLDGIWRIEGLAVDAVPAQGQAQASMAQPQAQTPQPAPPAVAQPKPAAPKRERKPTPPS